jgi:DNA-binding transcriptional LysR family regulator
MEGAKIELNKMRSRNDTTISLALSSPLLVKGIAVSFLAMYPDLKWQQSVSTLDDIVKMLQNGTIDFCITLPPIYCDNMETIILLENDYVIAAHPDHPIAKQEIVSLKQIAQENIISLHEGFSFHKQVDELFLTNNLSYNNVIECDHTLPCRHAGKGNQCP